jgi:glycosyltransferase involved in cell wall biosynthesis
VTDGVVGQADSARRRRTPRVSIVVPNYNYARYLDERLQTLLNQTFSDFELIITDDASTDDSRMVIERYTHDPRVRAIYFDRNSGSAYPRWNDAARQCRGEYLLFAGADDKCEPAFLERLVGVLDANPNVGLAYAQVWITDADGKRLFEKQYWNRPEHWAADYVNDGRDECRTYMSMHCTIPTASSVLMRRSLFEAVGPFDVSLPLCADWLLYARIAQRSDIAYVAEPLVDFRTHPQTARTAAAKGLRQVDDSYRVASYIASTSNLDRDQLERVRERMAEQFADSLLLGHGAEEPAQLRKLFADARRFDPGLRGRLFRKMLKRAPVGGIGRRVRRAVAVTGKLALRETLGHDALHFAKSRVKQMRARDAARSSVARV